MLSRFALQVCYDWEFDGRNTFRAGKKRFYEVGIFQGIQPLPLATADLHSLESPSCPCVLEGLPPT